MATINSDYTNLYIEDELAVGRVEVCWGGKYRPLCQSGWNNQSASVACRQLEFSPYGQLNKNIYYVQCLKKLHHNLLAVVKEVLLAVN